MGERKTIQFFQDSNVPDQSLPFASRVRNLARHSVFNPRQQEGVKAAYVKSCKARGICESVRGEAWATQPTANDDGRMGPYLLISSASLVEAFYTALNEEPGNPNLIATLRHGIQVRILSSRTPPGICKYLTKLHNRFHGGASTNFLELIGFIPDVENALNIWKQANGITWQTRDYESKCVLDLRSQFVKSHQDFGETFPEWKLYESARACQHLMSKRPGFLDTLTSDMAEFADFTHARLSNSVVLQCLQTVFTSIVSTIYDGMSSEDMDLLLLECCKLCVPHLASPDNSTWVFDSLSKRTLVQRLFTVMSGSVVSSEPTSCMPAKRRKGANQAGAKKKPKAKAAASNGAAEPVLPAESDVTSTTVACTLGVRNKLFVDDLMKCVNHCIDHMQAELTAIQAEDFVMVKRQLIRMGLLFAFSGQVMVETSRGSKVHKKWSSLRPALKAHGVFLLSKANA
ncbi:unnamed protein product [Effrenium voratum]|nr:unnamed protein product [Effrenium voratum]